MEGCSSRGGMSTCFSLAMSFMRRETTWGWQHKIEIQGNSSSTIAHALAMVGHDARVRDEEDDVLRAVGIDVLDHEQGAVLGLEQGTQARAGGERLRKGRGRRWGMLQRG